ncbi:ankyrin repeat-containing protein NPR4-like isoform X2 [Solanum stenotomum]|nr:ankyrin repeat-containing protein NPR4-like isoform X2 [Solanum stenotomum]
MKVGDLEKGVNTAFMLAALAGHVEIAKAMREKNKNLPNICGKEGDLPISVAAQVGHKAMVSYLYEVTDFDVIQQQELLYLLEITIQNEMYEVALNIFNKDRKLFATKILQGNINVFHTLSQKSIAISNTSSPVWRKLISVGRRQSISLLKLLPERYVVEKQAETLLEELWAECLRRGRDKLLDLALKENWAHYAAKAGNLGFLLVVTRDFPVLMWTNDDKRHTILHVAVLYREEKVFSLIHQIGGMKNIFLVDFDNDGNNILHLAGKLGEPIFSKQKSSGQMEALKNKLVQSVPPNADNNNAVFVESLQQLFQEIEIIRHITETQSVKAEEKIMPPSFLRVSGAALQMQREILWFKEVEKLVPRSLQKMTNKDGKTPRELFTEEHKILLKEGEMWMKDTANSCMIVSTLIATMVFAAGFTVPGGNNSDNGIPILLKLYGFRVFVISDAVALFTSIISISMFLSILTSRYAEDDFLVSLPAKILFGLTMLFASIVSMLLAFAATFMLVYSNHIGWEPKIIVACAGVPVALFGCLQYKLWFDVAKSTYWSKFLFRSGKHKLD